MIRSFVLRALVGCVVGGVALVAASLVATPALVQAPAGGGTEEASAAGPAAVPAQQRAARVSALLARHRCWTDAAPAGSPAPGHAVVTLPGGRPRLVAAEIGYGIWLDGDPGVVHGFCP